MTGNNKPGRVCKVTDSPPGGRTVRIGPGWKGTLPEGMKGVQVTHEHGVAAGAYLLYWPKETPPSIIDGTWKIPALKKVE